MIHSDQQPRHKTNPTKRKRETTLVDRIGTSTRTTQNQSSTQKEEKRTTTISNHHKAPPNPGRLRTSGRKTPSSSLAPSLPTMIHTELACCQAGLAAVGRYEPCSRHAIGSACAACQDDVPHLTSHCQVGLAAVARCKLPNQRVSSCLWRSPSCSRPPRTRRVQLLVT